MAKSLGSANAEKQCTTSRLRVWWLVKVHGYEVHHTTEQPKAGAFGQIRYVRHWWLRKPSTESDTTS